MHIIIYNLKGISCRKVRVFEVSECVLKSGVTFVNSVTLTQLQSNLKSTGKTVLHSSRLWDKFYMQPFKSI